jgi:hypothetical protein
MPQARGVSRALPRRHSRTLAQWTARAPEPSRLNGMTDDSHPRRIRREQIAPPEEPDESTLNRLQAQFATLPRINEAWLTGSRLTPQDGSPPYETTDIHLVLDPPIGHDNLVSQIEELEQALEPTGYRCERRRGWIFAAASPRETLARRLYSRSE